MRSQEQPVKETTDPALRDIIALSTLPGILLGAAPQRIAESLAAALFTTIYPEFVYVGLRASDKPLVSVAQTDRYETSGALAEYLADPIFKWTENHDPDDLLLLRDSQDKRTFRISCWPIGSNAELGVLAAGFFDERSPNSHHHLILSIAVSQAVPAVQNAHLLRSLKNSEERFRALVEASAQIVWTGNELGFGIEHSQSWRAFTGQSHLDASGSGWLTAVHPDDRATAETVWRNAIATKGPVTAEYRLKHNSGEWRWAALRAVPMLKADGSLRGWVGMYTDITTRKQAEATLREESEIVETINRTGQLLAAELDLQKLVQAFTDAATELAGARFGSFFYNEYTDAGGAYMLYTLSGAPRETFAHFPMPRATDLFGPTFRGEGVVRIDDVTKDPRYGKYSPYFGMPPGHIPVTSYLAVPVVSRSGQVLGGLFFGHPDAGVFTERSGRIIEGLAAQAAIAMDNAHLYQTAQRALAERDELLQREQNLRKHAEAANRMKDQFLATVSHELRTPLTAILGWANLLRQGDVPVPQLSMALETIERNARMQDQLVNDLLDIARITTGRLRLNVRPIDPAVPLEAAIEALRPAADAKGLRLQKIIDSGACAVSGDSERLQQIAWNLLSNAIKFTPRHGRIQVRLERVNSHIELSVSDTGIGIKPEFLPFVFDQFRQADSTTTRSHGGLGLGLAIVRHLVELHGGEVRAVSHGEGQGAAFIVKLPLIPVVDSGEATGERVHPRASDLALSHTSLKDELRGLRVLVIDDEPDTCQVLKMMLTSRGADVVTANSAAAALQEIETRAFHVLVSDIGMPGTDGYQLMREVRRRAADRGGITPAVALTAYARPEDRVRALRAGYQMHVTKPVEQAELVVVVASLAGKADIGNGAF